MLVGRPPPVPRSDMQAMKALLPKPSVPLEFFLTPSAQDSENAQVFSLSGCLWPESGLPWIVPFLRTGIQGSSGGFHVSSGVLQKGEKEVC